MQSMDFFGQQERAQRRTGLLLVLFGLAVLAALVVTYLVFATVILALTKPAPGMTRTVSILFTPFVLLGELLMKPGSFFNWLWDTRLAGWIIFGTLISIASGCIYKIRQLSRGGAAVAELLGGRRIELAPSDMSERKLRNVVEEMAIASGMPVPEIYLLDNERGINSFAAGHTCDDVAIGVTRGCLKLLTRDELQGVIAHEFSHVLNGDTRLNMRLMALTHGLFWPSLLGRMLLHGSTAPIESDESIFDEAEAPIRAPLAIIAFPFLFLGSINLPFVRLIKSTICRQREWLADAAAVQFTRNPPGITGALKKIGGLFKQGRLDTPHAETASHLYFADSGFGSWASFQSVHPPLLKRIRAIEPAFDGRFPKVKTLPPNQYERDQAYEQMLAGIMLAERKIPDAFLNANGSSTIERLWQVNASRLGLPAELAQALREPDGAMMVIFAVLLSANDSVRKKQWQIIRGQLDEATFQRLETIAPKIQAIENQRKLAMAELAMLALRHINRSEYAVFAQIARQLIECDGVIELFEYTLLKMVTRRLRNSFENPVGQTLYGTVKDVLPECALLLSALAHVGHEDDESAARAAFAQGCGFLDASSNEIQFLIRSEWDLAKVDAALDRLVRRPLAVTNNLMLACGKTVASDGRVTDREAALLRAIADSLNCPMPPFVEALRNETLRFTSY